MSPADFAEAIDDVDESRSVWEEDDEAEVMPMSDDRLTEPLNPRGSERRASRRRAEDSDRWDPDERERFKRDMTSTLAGQMREQLEQLDRERRESRIREEARLEAEEAEKRRREAEEDEEDRKRQKAWEDRKREQEFDAKEAEEKRAKVRARVFNGLLLALTTAVTGFGTYLSTRTPETTPEVQKAEAEAEAAKEEAVKTAVAATETDKEQDRKLRQLGLSDTEQIILQVDTADYQASMLKAMSSKAAAVDEPESLDPARKKANDIRMKKKIAAAKGEVYDPFPDLPGAEKKPD
jgi:hypothetical protein